MKKAWLVLFALVLIVCLTSCGGAKEIGSYELESITESGRTASYQEVKELYESNGLNAEFSLALNKDGTGKMVIAGDSIDITWDAKSKTMSHDNYSNTYIFEDNMIRITDAGSTLVFKKK